MKRIGRSVGWGLLLACLPVVFSTSADLGGLAGLKENLDLPFDAVGSRTEDDEDAPEIIVLYGGAYEGNAVVLCLDESKSMNRHNRWEIQKREAARAISELSEKAEFGVVFYGADAYWFRPNLLRATVGNKRAAIDFVASRQMTLGTCLEKGVLKSLRMTQKAKSKYRAVIVAGDGRPTMCPFVRGQGGGRNPQMIANLLSSTVSANPGLATRLHTIYVGQNSNGDDIAFMRRLASVHAGTFRLANR